MIHASAFSPDYNTARDRFRDSARRAGFRLETYPLGGLGPDDEILTLDAAILGPDGPTRAVVVSSGLHGVEGFLGSAVQARLLEAEFDEWSLPPGTSLILLHALNPHGFAHVRRFDERNVDLNRSFLLDDDYAGAPAHYHRLDHLLNPSRPSGRLDLGRLRALPAIARHGFADLKQAVAGGQYDYPRGLFFGGHGPSRLQHLLSERLPEWVGTAEDVLHFDVHTGLGRWAEYQLLLEDCVEPGRVSWLARRFGRDRVRVGRADGIAYRVRGGFGTWCESLFPGRSYTLLCAEFGTYPPLAVLAALRAENQLHHWGGGGRRAGAIKARFKEVFIPSNENWRELSVSRCVSVVRRGLEACREPVTTQDRRRAAFAPTGSASWAVDGAGPAARPWVGL